MSADRFDIHLIAIGGSGMAPLACLLKEMGHRVRGSDLPLYPPMSTLLAEAGIEPLQGFDPEHLDPEPDLVIVGNAVPSHNPEAVEAERRGLARISMPQALARFLLEGRRPLVVAGTHGKTTTTALAASVYRHAGADPGFLIGGVPVGLGRSFHRGGGERFIVEGDEYNAAYFDRGPKFLHYRAETLILTSVDYDHADLYPDPESLLSAYRRLVAGLPPRGLLVAYGDSEAVREVAAGAPCRVVHYGLAEENDLRPEGEWRSGPDGVRWKVREGDQHYELHLPLSGEHNLANALAVWAAARADGLAPDRVAAGLAAFRGVRRRMEIVGEADGVLLMDDFAHHPRAVEATLAALRSRYPDRRLVAVFEPRSLTAGRQIFFDDYLRAFAGADLVLLAPLFYEKRLRDGERLDLGRLVEELHRRGVEAWRASSSDALLEELRRRVEPGDLVVAMSSGRFDELPRRLLALLAPPQEAAPGQP